MTPNPENPALQQEWTTLQNNHEQYERGALLIKLTTLVLFVFGMVLALDAVLASMVVLLLWVQESIFRTSQARLGERILCIERLLLEPGERAAMAAFQLHSQWLAARPGLIGLLAEYAASARRPTVAFPYVVLLLMQWVLGMPGVMGRG